MTADSSSDMMRRRVFLRRLVRAFCLAAGTGAVSLALWDRTGPAPDHSGISATRLPSFALADQAPKMAVVRGGSDRSRALEQVLSALGGLKSFISPGDRVLIKVNAAFATPAILGATTHPDCVTRLVALCRAAGARRVMVTDNPINDPVSCFELTGIGPAARSAGAQLVLPGQDRFSSYSLPGGRLIQRWPVLTGPLLQVDKLIGLAPVKDHHRSGASMTLKNWYGLLGGRRNIFHQQIHVIIMELAMMVKPTLVILDGTYSMTANGPTGGSLDDLKATQTMIAGTDPVAVDTFGAELLNKTVSDLPHLSMAQKAGVGTTDYRRLNPVFENSGV